MRTSAMDSDGMAPDGLRRSNGAAACAASHQRWGFIRGGAERGVPVSNSYTDMLPTFNLRFRLKEDLQLRFAVGQGDRAPDIQPDDAVHGAGLGLQPAGPLLADRRRRGTGRGGNPNLKPTPRSSSIRASSGTSRRPAVSRSPGSTRTCGTTFSSARTRRRTPRTV